MPSSQETVPWKKYSFLQKTCCDPFNLHQGTQRKKSLHSMNLHTADQISSMTGQNVHPGQQLCTQCHHSFTAGLLTVKQDMFDPGAGPSCRPAEGEQEYCLSEEDTAISMSYKEQAAETLNASLTDAGYSPLKMTKLSKRDKGGYGKRKAIEAQGAATSQVASCLNIPPALPEETSQRKIQLLTLAPQSWTLEKTASEFSVSQYMLLALMLLLCMMRHGMWVASCKLMRTRMMYWSLSWTKLVLQLQGLSSGQGRRMSAGCQLDTCFTLYHRPQQPQLADSTNFQQRTLPKSRTLSRNFVTSTSKEALLCIW